MGYVWMVTAFDVIAEPRRREILDLLAQRELPVSELVKRLRISQPAVSKHLRVLREAGLVTSRMDAQARSPGSALGQRPGRRPRRLQRFRVSAPSWRRDAVKKGGTPWTTESL